MVVEVANTLGPMGTVGPMPTPGTDRTSGTTGADGASGAVGADGAASMVGTIGTTDTLGIPETQRWTDADFEAALQAFADYLEEHPEQHMQGITQGQQLEIFAVIFMLLRQRIPHFHAWIDLVVTCVTERGVQVFSPDALIVLGSLPECDRKEYRIGLEPQHPLLAIECVSDSSVYKDYELNLQRYSEARIPYYLIHDGRNADRPVLLLYQLNATTGQYEPVSPNAQGRLEIAPLQVEVGLVGRWARVWHKSELLSLPAEMQQQLAQMEQQLAQKDQALAQKDQVLAQQYQELAQKDQEILQLLRELVQARALLRGRQDIVAALPDCADPQQLRNWLQELN